MPEPATVVCHYRVKAGNESEFRKLLERHWPALREVELATDFRPIHLFGDENGAPLFIEIFQWRAEDSHRFAHQHPKVAAIWERMDKLCEARNGRPNMEFPHFAKLELID